MRIDAKGVHYKELNRIIKELSVNGHTGGHNGRRNGNGKVELINVNGQRYIGDGLRGDMDIEIFGTPGNDLAAFMDGPRITVHGNIQDGACNTMNSGTLIVHGSAGDVLGYSLRGGRVFIRDNVGYRACIHMKECGPQVPVVVVGGHAGDFTAEYMAGGVLIVLGLDNSRPAVGDYVCTGMHGGVVYIRGEVTDVPEGVKMSFADELDRKEIEAHLREFCGSFGLDTGRIMQKDFVKLLPESSRPYGKMYSH